MKRMVFFLVLMVTSFVFPFKTLAVELDGTCGYANKVCCEENGKLTCPGGNFLCVKRGKYNVCVMKNEKAGTCECEYSGTMNRFSCNNIDEKNYCDASIGQKAFCVTMRDLTKGKAYTELGIKCGYNIDNNFIGTCKCKTQVDANLDPEVNGYNRYYEFDTCVSGGSRSVLSSVYIDFDYCDKNIHEAKLFKFGPEISNYCRCVEIGHVGKYGNVDPMPLRDTSDKPGSGLSDIARQKINGVGITLFCEDNLGKIDNDNPLVNTAIGCVPVSTGGMVSWLIPKLVGIIGGISFLIMVYGFIMIATSEGDPKKAQAAKETITAAITGLILSIFAIFLVRLIMIYVLKLPGVK